MGFVEDFEVVSAAGEQHLCLRETEAMLLVVRRVLDLRARGDAVKMATSALDKECRVYHLRHAEGGVEDRRTVDRPPT